MMTKQFQNILRGIGSVMDIAPSTDYNRFVPKKTATERMQEHWERTGWHIQQAIGYFAHEQKEKNSSTNKANINTYQTNPSEPNYSNNATVFRSDTTT